MSYTSKDVADRLRIPPPTLRKWSRAFAPLLSEQASGKTQPGGPIPRRYTEDDLAVLSEAQALLRDGHGYAKVLQMLQERGTLQPGQRPADRQKTGDEPRLRLIRPVEATSDRFVRTHTPRLNGAAEAVVAGAEPSARGAPRRRALIAGLRSGELLRSLGGSLRRLSPHQRMLAIAYGGAVVMGLIVAFAVMALLPPAPGTRTRVQAVVPTAPAAAAPPSDENPIPAENRMAGTDRWQLELPGFQVTDDAVGQIKGYASATSVNKGEAIDFYITVSPVQTYTIDVYRVGWYDGKGARLMEQIGPLDGLQQSACAVDGSTGLAECNWQKSHTLQVPETWTSGIYIAQLTNAEKFQNYIIFAVRDDQRRADFLFQQSVTTYQAYNNYPAQGGKSLYDYNSRGGNTLTGMPRAVKVSFDRPYGGWGGAGQFFTWEIHLVRWAERLGYNLAYATDIDTHAHSDRLRNYRGILFAGNIEYWSKEMFDGVEAARDAGVSLGFLGADVAYFQIRFEPSSAGVPNRVMVCYKDASLDPVQDAGLKTVDWAGPELNRPPQTLAGVQYTATLTTTATVNATFVVTNSLAWVYEGTGLRDGDEIPGIVGYEIDRYDPDYPLPPNTSYTILSHSPITTDKNRDSYSNAVVYQAPSGAWVFATGTFAWTWGLDDFANRRFSDVRIQRITANFLNRVSAGHQRT